MAETVLQPYTPKYSFKQVINISWNQEEYGYDPVHIDKVVAITAASMWRHISKIAPEKWYTRMALELKKYVQTNRRRFNSLDDEQILQAIETEWVAVKHVTAKRALLSASPLYAEYDGDYVILEPQTADNFRKNLLLPGEKPVEDFRPSKQAIEKIEAQEKLQKERELLMQSLLSGNTVI